MTHMGSYLSVHVIIDFFSCNICIVSPIPVNTFVLFSAVVNHVFAVPARAVFSEPFIFTFTTGIDVDTLIDLPLCLILSSVTNFDTNVYFDIYNNHTFFISRGDPWLCSISTMLRCYCLSINLYTLKCFLDLSSFSWYVGNFDGGQGSTASSKLGSCSSRPLLLSWSPRKPLEFSHSGRLKKFSRKFYLLDSRNCSQRSLCILFASGLRTYIRLYRLLGHLR